MPYPMAFRIMHPSLWICRYPIHLWQPNLVGSPGRYPHALSGLYKLERDKNADSITLLLAKSHRQAEPMDR